ALLLRQLQQLAHAGIVAPRINHQPPHTSGGTPQQRAHRVQAIYLGRRTHCCCLSRRPRRGDGGSASGTRSRSIRPSTGLTEVTITRTCVPSCRRRLLRKPTQACAASSFTYSSSRRLSRCSRPSAAASTICTKQPKSTTVVMTASNVWPMRSRRYTHLRKLST